MQRDEAPENERMHQPWHRILQQPLLPDDEHHEAPDPAQRLVEAVERLPGAQDRKVEAGTAPEQEPGDPQWNDDQRVERNTELHAVVMLPGPMGARVVGAPMIPDSTHSAPSAGLATGERWQCSPDSYANGPALREQPEQSSPLVVAPGQLFQRMPQHGQQRGQGLRGTLWRAGQVGDERATTHTNHPG